MARAFILRYNTLDNSAQDERRFGALPIRIGRNPLNDCCLAFGFVSDFHVRIEDINGRICVRDLGSTNGVFVGNSQRLARHAPCDLAPYGYEFWIGPLMRLKLEILDQAQPVVGGRNPNARKTVLGNVEMMGIGLKAPPHRSAPGVSSPGMPSGAMPGAVPPGGPIAGPMPWQTPNQPLPAPGGSRAGMPTGLSSRPPGPPHFGSPPAGLPATGGMPAGPGGLPGLPDLPSAIAVGVGGDARLGWEAAQPDQLPALPPLQGASGAAVNQGGAPGILPDFKGASVGNSPLPGLSGALPTPDGRPLPLDAAPGVGGVAGLPPVAPGNWGPIGPDGLPPIPTGGGPYNNTGGGLPPLPPGVGGGEPMFPMASQPFPGQPLNAPEYASQPRGGGRGTNYFPEMAPPALALVGLQELATSLVPMAPLETKGDIARLVTKLHDTVDVFCRCFIPLRDGHAQFISSMDLQRAMAQRTMHRSKAFVQVETARDPASLAAALLDFRDPSPDAAQAIEGVFADLAFHQLGLLEGVMQGVRALLDELSPDAIEKAVDAGGSNPLGIGRAKSLWQAYRNQYEQIAEDKEAFSRIFGPEFTQAYREFQRRRGSSGNR